MPFSAEHLCEDLLLLRRMVKLPAWLQKARAELIEMSASHQEFLLLLALFVTLRLSLLVVSRPQGYFYDASDYDFYLEFGRMADRGLYPVVHYWTEYPPIFPWISVAAYRAVETLPTLNGSPILWLRFTVGSFLLLFDVGNLVLVYWLGRTLYAPARGLQAAWMYALFFTPLHVWLGWFDVMPLFFLLLSVSLALHGKPTAAAAAAGFGFMVKVFPILSLPLLLRAEQRLQGKARLLAWTAAAIVVTAAPFLVAGPQYLIASFHSLLSRSPWETPWAILEGYYGYGQVAPLQDRLDPSTASYQAYPSQLPWTAITVGFAALYLFLWSRPMDLRRGLSAVAFTGLTVNLFLLYSKGYSPQFLVYVVPFALLAIPPWRAITYLTVLSTINLLEYPTYIALFRDQDWLLRDLVGMRVVILLLMCWEYMGALEWIPTMAPVRRFGAGVALAGFVLWGAVALPAAGQEWARSSLAHHPDATLIDYLVANASSHAVVVITDQWLYRELYPYLHQRTNLLLVDTLTEKKDSTDGTPDGGTAPGKNLADQLDELSGQYVEIFGVRQLDDPNGRQVEQLLASRNRLVAGRRVNGLAVSRWFAGRG